MANILDIPETKVRLGSSLDPNTIREGTDVYFDCLVSAHPHVYKVEWRHNVNIINFLSKYQTKEIENSRSRCVHITFSANILFDEIFSDVKIISLIKCIATCKK